MRHMTNALKCLLFAGLFNQAALVGLEPHCEPSQPPNIIIAKPCPGFPQPVPLGTCLQNTYNRCVGMIDPCRMRYSELYIGGLGFGTKIDVGTFGNPRHGTFLRNFFGKDRDGEDMRHGFFGMDMGYTYRKPCNLYLNLDFGWASGPIGGHRHVPKRYLHYYLGQSRIGYNFTWDCYNLLLTPYTGFGFRYVNHTIVRHQEFMHYRNYFAILGGRIDWQFLRCWSIGLDGQWQIQVDSAVRLSSVPEVRFRLNPRNGFVIEMPVCYNFLKGCMRLSAVPLYRRNVDGRSNVFKTAANENARIPQQTNREWGGKLLLSYLF